MPNAQEQRRQQAIDRYLAGNPIEDICRELACSKSWLYKWRDRYVANAPCWRQALSRRPNTTPTKTPTRIEQAVVSLRHPLAQNGQACGAASIQQALAQHGIKPVPSLRTINRMLHRDAQEVA